MIIFYSDSSAETYSLGACEDRKGGEGHTCSPGSDLDKQASQFCRNLVDSPSLSSCHSVLNPLPFYETCRWSYCSGSTPDSSLGSTPGSTLAGELACQAD